MIWIQRGVTLARLGSLDVFRVPVAASQLLAALAQRSMQLQATIQEGVLIMSDGSGHVEVEPLRWR